MSIEDVRKLLEIKKQQGVKEEEKEKLEFLEIALQNDALFFTIDITTAIGILQFLGVEKEKIKETYFELVSSKNYQKSHPSVRYSIENEQEEVTKK